VFAPVLLFRVANGQQCFSEPCQQAVVMVHALRGLMELCQQAVAVVH
jgi:hypothetical protein